MANTDGKMIAQALNRLKKSIHLPTEGELKTSELFMLFSVQGCIQKEGKYISESGRKGVRISQISRFSNYSMPAVSQFVGKLEGCGYLERFLIREDRRVVYVCMTDAGKALLKKSGDCFFQKFNNAVEKMGKEKTIQLIALLDELSSALQDQDA